jgi:hypothetical protein
VEKDMNNEFEPNAAVEIHDSMLESIKYAGDVLVVVIDGYVHRSSGSPGVDPGSCWNQVVELHFLKGKASGAGKATSIELLDGRLVLSGEVFENAIPLPLNHRGDCRLELESWNDIRSVFEGEGVSASFVGPPSFIENFTP